jgi:hypothetical protein
MAMNCTKKLTFVMIALIIFMITKVQANNHVPTFLHPSPLHIHHSHPSQLDTSNGDGPSVSCIKKRVDLCHVRRGRDLHFDLLCIEFAFVTCLGEEKDDPMYSDVDHWVSTCYEEMKMGRTPSMGICLLKFFEK